MSARREKSRMADRPRIRSRQMSREEVRAEAFARTGSVSVEADVLSDLPAFAGTERSESSADRQAESGSPRPHRGWRRGRKSSWSAVPKALFTLGASALLITGLRVVAIADDDVDSSGNASYNPPTDFTKRPYVGIGAGITRLEPSSPTSFLTIDDNRSTGAHVMVGYDIVRWLSAELYFADLGEADIGFISTPVGDVSYQVYGVSALAYVFNSTSGLAFSGSPEGLHRREGLSVYGRFGIGGMQNASDLDYRRDYASHAVFGVGVEYGFRNGFAVRAELEGFDTDARYLSASVLKRFGKVRTAPPVAVVQVPAKVIEPAPIVVLPEAPTQFSPIVPPYLYFGFDEATLSEDAKARLATFVEAIQDTDLNIHVEGHTDWTGGEGYNDALSLRRAIAVRDHLVTLGVDGSRIQAVGLGESFPLSSNSSAQGRAENRRAEMRLK